MGCCGKKRQAWSDSNQSISKAVTAAEESPKSIPDRVPQVFENREDQGLVIQGAVTGKNYYFKEKGFRIPVAYLDSFAMRAESGLKIVTGKGL